MQYKNEIDQLNEAILKIAPLYRTTPEPYEEIPTSLKGLNELHKNERILISDYACDNTIYGKDYVNFAFRSWHDTLHVLTQLSMTFEDEMKLGLLHTQTIKRLGLSPICQAIMYFDTCGQSIYYSIWGDFPVNQKQFVLGCLKLSKKCYDTSVLRQFSYEVALKKEY